MALEKFGPHKYQRVHRAFQAKVAGCFFVVKVGELYRPILFAPYDNRVECNDLLDPGCERNIQFPDSIQQAIQ